MGPQLEVLMPLGERIGRGWCSMGGGWVFSKLGETFTSKRSFFYLSRHCRSATAAQVNGFPNTLQASYKTLEDAEAAWAHARANNSVGSPSSVLPISHMSPIRPSWSLTRPPSPALHARSTGVAQPPLPIRNRQGSPIATSSEEPQPEEPQAPSPGQVAPPAPRHLRMFHSLPSTPTSPGRAAFSTRRSPAQSPIALDDEMAYWVVKSGIKPGVYHGR